MIRFLILYLILLCPSALLAQANEDGFTVSSPADYWVKEEVEGGYMWRRQAPGQEYWDSAFFIVQVFVYNQNIPIDRILAKFQSEEGYDDVELSRYLAEIREFKDAQCVFYDGEKLNPEVSGESNTDFVQRTKGYECLYPFPSTEEDTVIVNIGFSERLPKSRSDISFATEAQQFFDNFQFVELTQ